MSSEPLPAHLAEIAADDGSAGARPVPAALRRLATVRWSIVALVALIGSATLVAATRAQGIGSPWIFPDELVYWDLARNVASTGHLAIRGATSTGHPPLYPLTPAPSFAAGDWGGALARPPAAVSAHARTVVRRGRRDDRVRDREVDQRARLLARRRADVLPRAAAARAALGGARCGLRAHDPGRRLCGRDHVGEPLLSGVRLRAPRARAGAGAADGGTTARCARGDRRRLPHPGRGRRPRPDPPDRSGHRRAVGRAGRILAPAQAVADDGRDARRGAGRPPRSRARARRFPARPPGRLRGNRSALLAGVDREVDALPRRGSRAVSRSRAAGR